MSDQLELIVGKLAKRGLSPREISGAFKRRFSIKVTFNNGQPNLDQENAKRFVKNKEEINRHFEAFLKTKGKHAGYCRRELQKRKDEGQKSPQGVWLRLLKSCGLLGLGVVSAVLLGLFWILKNYSGKLSLFVMILSMGMALYHQDGGGYERGHPEREQLVKWTYLMLGSGAFMLLRLAIGWFRDPVFCPSAAKGLYMGQSLNNQREIKESLNDIRDTLDS